MTARSAVLEPAAIHTGSGIFLGFRTVFRKEVTEWLRGRRAVIVGAVSLAAALLSTVVPVLVPKGSPGAAALTMDPTANVLAAWGGLNFAIVALLATMSLMSSERDRGTLAWNLSHPVSPASILAAKWIAAILVYGLVGVILPLAIASAVATVVYGTMPELGTIALFALLFLTVPAFYIGLVIALGTSLRSTAGIAGVGFLVMFLPTIAGELLPIVRDISPTSIGAWAMATATGGPASILTLVGWLVSMTILAIGAKLVFDRQEF
jgi:ABC-2 type transport system permease protein